MLYTGTVIKGAGEAGEVYNLPTANLFVKDLHMPGIYAGRTFYGKKSWPSLIYVRENKDGQNLVETHLFGFIGDLYGQEISIDLIEKIRDLETFSSVEQMRGLILDDVKEAHLKLHLR